MGCIQSKPKEAGPKLIVVFGATGIQGGSVVRALKDDVTFKIRAVTRNPESDKAKALSEGGLEVVAADLDDVNSLKTAIEGAYGVFGVTNYWELFDKEKETQQGKNIADACKFNNIQHVLFSTVENVKDVIGKECPHCDGKAEIDAYMKSLGKKAFQRLPLTSIRVSFYMENLLNIMKPQKVENDVFSLGIPMEGKVLDMVPAAEIGECIHQIFKAGKKYIGKAIGLSSHKATIDEYAEILTKHLEGKTFKATEMTAEEFSKLEFPGAADLAVMFEFYQNLKLVRDVTLTKSLNPKISDFDTWVRNNKEALNVALE